MCSSSGESYQYDIWYMSLCVGDLDIPSKPAYQTVRVTYTRCHIDTIDSSDDEHLSARNMKRFGINIYEKRTVRQVGFLQELYLLCSCN